MLDHTGERLSIKVYSRIMVEHLHRYAFAGEFVKNKVVLDIACGEGYGTRLLANNAKFAYGIDISQEAVEHASNHYVANNLQYLKGDACSIPLQKEEIDLVVSFETIEHISGQELMIQECKRVLKKDGLLIISTPDKKYYSEIPGYHNPFHVKELYPEEFRNLVSKYFSNIVLYKQGIVKGGIIYTKEISAGELKVYQGNYEDISKAEDISSPEFIILVAGNIPFETKGISFFESGAVDQKLILEIEKYKKLYEKLLHSNTYRVGKLLTAPIRALKAITRKE